MTLYLFYAGLLKEWEGITGKFFLQKGSMS